MTDARNVLGEPLAECCIKPMTGFYRDLEVVPLELLKRHAIDLS
jgi:uncharacterized protein (DUF2237 family)